MGAGAPGRNQRSLRNKQRDPRAKQRPMQNQKWYETLSLEIRPEIKSSRETDEHGNQYRDGHAGVEHTFACFCLSLCTNDF